jgi:hypothetical protein
MKSGRMWLLVGGLLALGVIAIGWFLGASPLLAQAAANEAQVADIDAANDAQMIEIAQMKQQFEDIDELRAELDRLQLSVPGFADTGDFLDEIAAKAGAAGVALQTVTVEGALPYGAMGSTQSSEEPSGDSTAAPADSGTTSGAQGQIPAPTVPGVDLAGDLYVLTVKFEVDADQGQLAAFLAALQGDGRLLLISELTSSFGTSQRSSITGHIFVVHDPRLGVVGALPTPSPTPTPTPSDTATTGATPTPTPTGTPAP